MDTFGRLCHRDVVAQPASNILVGFFIYKKLLSQYHWDRSFFPTSAVPPGLAQARPLISYTIIYAPLLTDGESVRYYSADSPLFSLPS